MGAGTIERRADGNWTWIGAPVGPRSRSCLFLDRDGVLIEERNYLADPAGVVLIPGARETIARAKNLGWAVVVVTNQAGIGRGYFSWDDFEAVQARMLELLAPVAPDMALACPYHVDGVPPWNHESDWRKPGAGMVLAAAAALPLDLRRSIIVGDRLADIEAGRKAGLALGVHVLTGHGSKERAQLRTGASDGMRVIGVDSIADIPVFGP